MKTAVRFLPLLVCLLLAGSTGLILQGCKNRPSAVKTLLTVGESVNSAMNVYGELVRAGVLSEAQKVTVRQRHATYQVAYNEAARLVASDLSKLAPAEVADLAAELITVIYQLKAAHPIP